MKRILLAGLIITAFLGCSKNDEPCTYNECGTVAPNAEIQSLQSYLTANNITATQHCSGIFYVIEQPGTGTKANACNTITLNYKGMLTNGTVFDSTVTNKPASFNLSGTVTGFKNGLMQLRPGGKMRLFIPPSLGYGSSGRAPIPGNAILIFNVELLSVQ